MSTAPIDDAAFDAVLRLQDLDLGIDQLVHRRAHLPSHEAVVSIEKRAGVLRPKLVEAQAVRDKLLTKQSEIELEVAGIEKRVAEINSRLYGTVQISPKDAQAMQEEVIHLKERQTTFEDRDLELMEALEPAIAEFSKHEGEAKALGLELKASRDEMSNAQAEIDTELVTERGKRAELAAQVPDALLEEYEKVRKAVGGIGAARIEHGSCGGCHLTLSASELAIIRKAPEGTIPHCEECGRILVSEASL